jgi:hypothetical protein
MAKASGIISADSAALAQGGMRRQDDELDLAFFDDLAMISSEPDARSDELNALYRHERVRVPRTVFNAELKELQEL